MKSYVLLNLLLEIVPFLLVSFDKRERNSVDSNMILVLTMNHVHW